MSEPGLPTNGQSHSAPLLEPESPNEQFNNEDSSSQFHALDDAQSSRLNEP